MAGAVLILSAFAGAQAGRLAPRSVPYLWLNVVGAGILTVDAFLNRQWGFFVLESVWTAVSLAGLLGRRAAPDAVTPPTTPAPD